MQNRVVRKFAHAHIVILVSSESGIQVSVQLDDDTVAPKDLSAEILLALREQLR